MKHLKQYCFSLLLLFLFALLLQNTSCTKEFSFEGADRDSIPSDTLITPQPIKFPACSLCDSSRELFLGAWNFKTGNSYLCGTSTNSGFFAGTTKTAFTFFGPSACSVDTGIVVSVYLPVPLDRDRDNITTTNTAFYYYDHNAPKDIFISRPTSEFSVTVLSFIYATGIVTGTFKGAVFEANGDTAYITDGHFKAQL